MYINEQINKQERSTSKKRNNRARGAYSTWLIRDSKRRGQRTFTS